jgi:hypothetical protein
MKAVKFLKKYDPYEPGHVVDLDDKLADKLIEKGIARFCAVSRQNVTVVTTEKEGSR